MDEKTLSDLVIDSLTKAAPDIDPNLLDPGMNFRDQFEIDSVDFLGFVLDLEKRLKIRIPVVDYPKLSSMKGCLAHLAPILKDR
jgi:acyl carrier protein